MKVSAEKKAQNREAILAVAGRLLREKGPSGIGVAEVMAGAGMTHGGFYGHFASREGLAAEALTLALAQTTDDLSASIAEGGLDGLAARYLDSAHLDDVGGGCPIAATATDIPRQPAPIRAAFAIGLRDYLDAVIPSDADRTHAIARMSSMIGALILARAVVGEDRALAEELLQAAHAG